MLDWGDWFAQWEGDGPEDLLDMVKYECQDDGGWWPLSIMLDDKGLVIVGTIRAHFRGEQEMAARLETLAQRVMASLLDD